MAGFTDPDPNVTPPSIDTIVRFPAGRFVVAWGIGFAFSVLTTFLADGTSAQIRVWYFDESRALWVTPGFNSLTTLTYSANNTSGLAIRIMPGAKFFVQVVTNTGASKFAIALR